MTSTSNIFLKLSSGIRFKDNKKLSSNSSSNHINQDYDDSLSRIMLFGNNDNKKKKTQEIYESDNDNESINNSSNNEKENDSSNVVSDSPFNIVNADRIKIFGDPLPFDKDDIHNTFSTFESFGLKEWIIQNIYNRMQWTSPTPIQKICIPSFINDRDVLVSSPTGSGKTGSYVIPILQLIKPHSSKKKKSGSPKALIIAPTKELTKQIYLQFKKLSEGKPFKISMLGKDFKDSSDGLSKSIDVIISTPSRLLYFVKQELIDISKIEYLVLDEIDRLLSDDFIGQIDEIVTESNNPKRKISMFSATLLPSVEKLADSILKNPIRAIVGIKNIAVENVDQKLKYVGSEEGKLLEIRNLIINGLRPPVIIFVQSKERANQLFHELIYENISVGIITSAKTEQQRLKTIEKFRTGDLWVLIATDVLSRGIDFKSVSTVINYDMPNSATSYVHRVGRTGRMGKPGLAITLFTDEDIPYIRPIVNVMINSGQSSNVPEWMLSIKNLDARTKRIMAKRSIEREDIVTELRMKKRAEKLKEELRNKKKRKRN